MSDLACNVFIQVCVCVQRGGNLIHLDFKELGTVGQCTNCVWVRREVEAERSGYVVERRCHEWYRSYKLLEVVASHCLGAPFSPGCRVRPVVCDWYRRTSCSYVRCVRVIHSTLAFRVGRRHVFRYTSVGDETCLLTLDIGSGLKGNPL